jgi:hypothetical protein
MLRTRSRSPRYVEHAHPRLEKVAYTSTYAKEVHYIDGVKATDGKPRHSLDAQLRDVYRVSSLPYLVVELSLTTSIALLYFQKI